MSEIVILGAALTPFGKRRDGTGFRDWSRAAFDAACLMSDIEPSAIDALVVASESDFFSMQLNPSALLASELGLVGAAAMRVEGGGASGQLAVHAACGLLHGKSARCVAVIGFDSVATGLPAQTVKALYGLSFDAIAGSLTGASATVQYALSFQDFAARTGTTTAHLDAVTISNRSNACRNPGAHLPRMHNSAEITASAMISSPYRRLHCSPLSDGAAALILATAEFRPTSRRSASKILGIGSATDHANLGSRRKPGLFSAKRTAMQRASSMAGISPKQIAIAEVYDAFAGAQLQAIEALGLSENLTHDLENRTFSRDGGLPVNLSGGLMGQGAPVGATGVGQTATCALLLEGRYHDGLQPARPLGYALADTHGGVCTNAAVTILGAA